MKHLLFIALAGAALLDTSRPAAAQAPNSGVRLILSTRRIDKAPAPDEERSNVLRPNVEQELLTYIQNDGPEAKTVKVQLLADGVEVIPTKDHQVGSGKLVQFPWPHLAEPPAAKPTPLTRPVVFRLLDANGNKLGEDKTLSADRPGNYLDAKPVFIPRRGSESNRLIVKLTPNDKFKGPPCRIQLVLDPERIPSLIAGQKKKGFYAGSVTGEKNEDGFRSLNLIAEDIRLMADESQRSGVVTVQADGYDRAFTFVADFPASGTASTPGKRGEQTLRLNLPRFVNPHNPVPVVIEADNLKDYEDARLVLEAAPLLADKKEAGNVQFSLLEEFRGERNVQLFFRGNGKNGGLRFVPEVKDWSKNVDLGGLFGSAVLRLRLLDKDGGELEILDGETGNKTKEVRKTVTLDDTPPEVTLVPVSSPIVRGKPIVVEAQGSDEESGIGNVIFFVGKLAANAPLPPDAIARPGKQKDRSTWAAELVVPSDARSPLDVSVRFTNKVGLTTTQATALEVAEPPPPGVKVAKKGSIAGVVMEGERPQKGLNVDLLDPAGKVLLSTKTAADGTFIFKDLVPGDYKLASIKPASSTRGSTRKPIPLAEGEAKTIVIKLWRQ
jgi:hypothetical protein